MRPLSPAPSGWQVEDIGPVPPNKRAVNMMFQSYALFPHLSVWENIAFGLRREGWHKDLLVAPRGGNAQTDASGKICAPQTPSNIGGTAPEGGLGRAPWQKRPNCLLLDEPLGALDKKLRQDTQFELMDIQETTGTTFVIVTHDQEEAMTVASRVAVMDEGRLIQVDTPDRIYEAPNSVYVADFIGDVNIIQGRADLQGDRVHINWAEGQPPIIGTSIQQFQHRPKRAFRHPP